MNLSYFIANRISHFQREGFSSTIHKIAIGSIGIGLGALIVSFLILKGFQETVKNKIYGFSGHLLVTKFTMNNSLEESPMDFNIPFYKHYHEYPYVAHIQEYAHKTGLIKTDNDVLGVVFKGVGKSFDLAAFKENIIEGSFIDFPDSGYSSQVVLSKVIADKLTAKVGDNLVIHFFQDPPRYRRLKVSGIYETNLSEYFDGHIIIGDIRLIQRLEGWADSICGGLEVFATDIYHIDDAGRGIGERIDYDLNIERVSDRYMQVFEWLELVSRQVNILLVIILLVVCINMISIVLILVMERTQMIGMLKALGATDSFIQRIFIHRGVSLILKGLAFGNILGLGLCYLQYKFEIIKLNAADYYMSVVPISWHWEIVIWLNLLTFIVVTLILLLPTMIISRINPIKAIRFD
ncbi:MAG TPA: FtsX-like permease family protein [Cyclobacteriaceae bacterium]|nr:FtsX-like permease family protein [Cyclobacteriaceae bacterium]